MGAVTETPNIELRLADGKYVIGFNPQTYTVNYLLRHGEPWGSKTVDNLTLALVHEVYELRRELAFNQYAESSGR